MVSLLKKQNIAIDLPPVGGQSALDFLEQSKMLWENTVNKAYRVKEGLQTLQNSMLEGVRKDLQSFSLSVKKFEKDFRENGPFHWLDFKQKDAYKRLDHYMAKLLSFQEKATSLNELEDLFELPMTKYVTLNPTQLPIPDPNLEPNTNPDPRYSSLETISEDISLLKKVWDTVLLVESLFTIWRATLWAEIKVPSNLITLTHFSNQMNPETNPSSNPHLPH